MRRKLASEYDQMRFPLFVRFWKCLLNTWLEKFCSSIFVQRQFNLSLSFIFHGSPSKLTDWTSEE